jgi:hypothetical protein
VAVVLGPTGASQYFGSVHAVAAVFPPSPCETTIYTIEDATEVCTVTYTLDGSTPTVASLPYSRPIRLGVGVWTVMVALWSDAGALMSGIISQTFTVVEESRALSANTASIPADVLSLCGAKLFDAVFCGQVLANCLHKALALTTRSMGFRIVSICRIV